MAYDQSVTPEDPEKEARRQAQLDSTSSFGQPKEKPAPTQDSRRQVFNPSDPSMNTPGFTGAGVAKSAKGTGVFKTYSGTGQMEEAKRPQSGIYLNDQRIVKSAAPKPVSAPVQKDPDVDLGNSYAKGWEPKTVVEKPAQATAAPMPTLSEGSDESSLPESETPERSDKSEVKKGASSGAASTEASDVLSINKAIDAGVKKEAPEKKDAPKNPAVIELEPGSIDWKKAIANTNLDELLPKENPWQVPSGEQFDPGGNPIAGTKGPDKRLEGAKTPASFRKQMGLDDRENIGKHMSAEATFALKRLQGSNDANQELRASRENSLAASTNNTRSMNERRTMKNGVQDNSGTLQMEKDWQLVRNAYASTHPTPKTLEEYRQIYSPDGGLLPAQLGDMAPQIRARLERDYVEGMPSNIRAQHDFLTQKYSDDIEAYRLARKEAIQQIAKESIGIQVRFALRNQLAGVSMAEAAGSQMGRDEARLSNIATGGEAIMNKSEAEKAGKTKAATLAEEENDAAVNASARRVRKEEDQLAEIAIKEQADALYAPDRLKRKLKELDEELTVKYGSLGESEKREIEKHKMAAKDLLSISQQVEKAQKRVDDASEVVTETRGYDGKTITGSKVKKESPDLEDRKKELKRLSDRRDALRKKYTDKYGDPIESAPDQAAQPVEVNTPGA